MHVIHLYAVIIFILLKIYKLFNQVLNTLSLNLFVFLSQQKCQVGNDQHYHGIDEQPYDVEPGIVLQEI